MSPTQKLRGWWNAIIPEPRWISIIYSIGYSVTVAMGIVTLIYPPQTLTGAVGEVSMTIAGILWFTGGTIGMLSGQREWWEGERYALAMMLVGITFYAWIITGLHFEGGGSRLTQLGVLALAGLFLLLRFGFIWRYPFKPRG